MAKNKKGGIRDLLALGSTLTIVILIGFIIVFMAVVFMHAFGIFTINLTNPALYPQQTNTTNVTLQFTRTFGQENLALQQLRWISFAIIFAMFLGFLVSAFQVKAHPGWIFGWVVFSAIATLFSIYLSRAYQTVYSMGGDLGNTFQSFSGSSYMLINLPTIVAAIGAVGAILLFVRMNTGQEGNPI